MKKLVMTVAVLACAVSFVSAETVTSANVVGYAKKSTPDAGLNIQGNPFLGTNTVEVTSLYGDTLPVGSKLYIYSGGAYSSILEYQVSQGPPPGFVKSTNWNGSAIIDGTTGYWLELPSGSGALENIFSGEVPYGDLDITLEPGLNMINYPYPADMVFTNTALGQNPVVGDKVYTWSTDLQTYSVINEYQISQGPPPLFIKSTNWADKGMILRIAEGVWYESADSVTTVISESQPYADK